MGKISGREGLIDAAVGAIVADGCFCLAFMLHVASTATTALGLEEYLALGVIVGIFVASCWMIYHAYWHGRPCGADAVKKLRIRELQEGAALEFDGKSYRVDTISRSMGRVEINRVGEPGGIIVEIEKG